MTNAKRARWESVYEDGMVAVGRGGLGWGTYECALGWGRESAAAASREAAKSAAPAMLRMTLRLRRGAVRLVATAAFARGL